MCLTSDLLRERKKKPIKERERERVKQEQVF